MAVVNWLIRPMDVTKNRFKRSACRAFDALLFSKMINYSSSEAVMVSRMVALRSAFITAVAFGVGQTFHGGNAFAQGAPLNPSDLQFCNTVAQDIQSRSSREITNISAKTSASGSLIELSASGSLEGSYASDKSLSESMKTYRSKNCDSLLRYYGQVQVATITANAMIEVERIRAQVAMRSNDNTLSGVRDTNATNLGIAKDTNNTNLLINQGNNQTSLQNSAISGGFGLLGALMNNNSGNKERELRLQMAREQRDHELRMLAMQMQGPQASGYPMAQPPAYPTTPSPSAQGYGAPQAYPSQAPASAPVLQPVPVSASYAGAPYPAPGAAVYSQTAPAAYPQAVPYGSPRPVALGSPALGGAVVGGAFQLNSAEQEISARFGLAIDKSCSPRGILIRMENSLLVCAVPNASFQPGRYLFTSGKLVRY